MSGILSAIQAAGQLFGGYGLVTLGPVVLQSIEVPDRIPVGGAQMLAVHKLPGGQRVLDAMGRDDSDLAWSGILSDAGAESRMQLLDSLRQSGTPIQLTFGQSSFTVVVCHFMADYERANWIPYSISCTVVQDNAAKFGSTSPSLLGSLNNDLNSALGFNVAATTSAAIGTAQTAINAVGALGFGSSAFITASSAFGSAQKLLNSEQAASTGTLSAIIGATANAGNILGVSRLTSAASAFSEVASAASDLAATTQAGAYLNRAAVNLSNASA